MTLDRTASAGWAVADPGSVAQILRILLDNALRPRRRPARRSRVGADGSTTVRRSS